MPPLACSLRLFFSVDATSCDLMRWWIAAIFLVGSVVFFRVWTSARAELEVAQTAESAGDIEQAIEHFQYAARWYTPFGSAPNQAIEALWRIGQAEEKSGKQDSALRAYRRLRGAILATRSLYSPFEGHRVQTNERIAALMADEQLRLGQATIAGRSRSALVRDHLSLLNDDPAPSTGWSLLIVLCFLGWVAGTLGTIYKGMDRHGKIMGSSFKKWLLFSLVCFGGWILGLSQA